MFSVQARYRGRAVRRAELVRRSAEALATLPGVGQFEILGVEDIRAVVDTPEALCDTVMALLSDGEWAVGIVVAPTIGEACDVPLVRSTRAGSVQATVLPIGGTYAQNIASAFSLIAHVLAKRTFEGREATSLMRSGLNQNEAAAQLGISKQAMSQRLQAAGWQAETAGWQLAVNLLIQANQHAHNSI